MNSLIEITLALFWTGYAALMWRLLRGPANDAIESIQSIESIELTQLRKERSHAARNP